MLRKIISVCSAVFMAVFFSAHAFCQNSAAVANRRTAVRYLQIARQCASEKRWNETESNAQMGLAYDESIADLWYLCAVAGNARGEKKSAVIPIVEKSLNGMDWVDYNKAGARVLYADLLCAVRRFADALSVLDSSPFLYSADAEYIRAKAYYNQNDDENVRKARAKIDTARRVYPDDPRFAQLFYEKEYQIFRRSGRIDESVLPLANAFAIDVPFYKDADDSLELFSAVFAVDAEKKERILKAFRAKNLRSPLYALEALRVGLVDEAEALDCLYEFSDDTIDISILEDFVQALSTDEGKSEFAQYLNSYNGTIVFDTDSDLVVNMRAVYKRGRPEYIEYDENQDGDSEWTAVCDFGVPVSVHIGTDGPELFYRGWPYIKSASYIIDGTAEVTFNLISERLGWSPFSVVPDSIVAGALGADFFIPVAGGETNGEVSVDVLLKSSLSCVVPSKEREGAEITIRLLDGIPQVASYSTENGVYAMAYFKDGIPDFRAVDTDGDARFETTELYGLYPSAVRGAVDERNSVADEYAQVLTNLFGFSEGTSRFYVKMIQLDRNGDTIPDFVEEYLPGARAGEHSGKRSFWDTDSDGKWDIQYTKHPFSSGGILREEATFHQPFTESEVTVFSENGIPVSVKNGSETLSVTGGENEHFYWISEPGSQFNEESILFAVNQNEHQGVSMVVDSMDERFFAVRIENVVFGMKVPSDETAEKR